MAFLNKERAEVAPQEPQAAVLETGDQGKPGYNPVQKSADSFMDQISGDGLEVLDNSVLAIPYLSIAQPMSDAVISGDVEAGNFVNGISKESYGSTLNVIVTAFKICWVERDSGGKTVNRYEPGSIKVTGDLWKGMTNPETSNKVQESWLYQLLLADRLDQGFLVYGSTPGQMRYLKGWHTRLTQLRTPSGKPAPIYGGIWEWKLAPDQNKAGKPYFSLKGGIKFVSYIKESDWTSFVKPARDQQKVLQIAPPEVDAASASETDY